MHPTMIGSIFFRRRRRSEVFLCVSKSMRYIFNFLSSLLTRVSPVFRKPGKIRMHHVFSLTLSISSLYNIYRYFGWKMKGAKTFLLSLSFDACIRGSLNSNILLVRVNTLVFRVRFNLTKDNCLCVRNRLTGAKPRKINVVTGT